jgi:hypothetical protein
VDELRRDEPDDQGDRYETKVSPTAAGTCGARTVRAIGGLDRKVGSGDICAGDGHRIG